MDFFAVVSSLTPPIVLAENSDYYAGASYLSAETD